MTAPGFDFEALLRRAQAGSDERILIGTVDAAKLVDDMRRLLAGQPPEAVGAALAFSLAMLVAGHVVKGDRRATRATQASLLAMHIGEVEAMIPTLARMLGTDR